MSRTLHDVASGTLFGVALNYQGLLNQRLAEFEQPPYQKPPVKPVLFIKTPNTRNSHDGIVHQPHGERLQPGPHTHTHTHTHIFLPSLHSASLIFNPHNITRWAISYATRVDLK